MKRNGFTLIELLIVVAIIGVLAAIAVPNFLNAQVRAKVAKCVSNMRTVSQGLEMYFLDKNTYPHRGHDGNLYAGLRDLTTPVAYITSAASENPFSSGYQKKLNGMPDGRELDPRFELGTYRRVGPRNGGPDFQLELFPTNIWLLESSGPDLGDDYPTTLYPIETPLIYHPTNGTVSRGDIYGSSGYCVHGEIL